MENRHTWDSKYPFSYIECCSGRSPDPKLVTWIETGIDSKVSSVSISHWGKDQIFSI